jgi:hypothetical protein
MTAKMCSTTGSGCARNRAFAAVTFAPLASCASLIVPAIAGTRLNTINSIGIHQSEWRALLEELTAYLETRRTPTITTTSLPVRATPFPFSGLNPVT